MTFHQACIGRGCYDRPAIASVPLQVTTWVDVGKRFARRAGLLDVAWRARLCAGCEHALAVNGSIELKPELF